MTCIKSAVLGTLLASATTAASTPLAPEAVGGFIQQMEQAHGFSASRLERLFAGVERSEHILELMSRPAEKVKPWWEYRDLFISGKRIADGVDFWREHATSLQRAEREYGVAPEVIVAIIGVETSYGRITGNYRVIDALATLAFHYPGGNPARTAFFRSQLEHLLLLAREENADPLSFKGSYAGAMGMPQFMPENFRKLAVDFDGDGARDIWADADDTIGSVANYLNHHGWQRGAPVLSPAVVHGERVAELVQDSLAPERTLRDLIARGISPARAESHDERGAALFGLEGREGTEYWIGYTNFYVISRYNPRLKYTMAVAQLADAIRDRYQSAR